MSLVTTEQLLLDAQKRKYAVGAFNVENMEMVQAVIAASEELKAPVILQTTPSTVKYAGLEYYYAMVKAAAETTSVPVAIHLDHGNSYELAMQALRVGYTSIMIDGSHSPFNENIKMTQKVVDACMPSRVPVEAELGKVGGKEDDLDGGKGGYTDPNEAKEFVEKTRVTFLAVAIGTAHGIYSGEPKLDLDLLSKIRRVVDIPLVLHGASGLSDDAVRESIKRGICKVNFATELRIAFSNGVKEVLLNNPDTYDPKKYNAAGRENTKQIVINRMKVCGCDGKARY
ncbi:MAG: class II fructose-1,6-bisphosphate aldolase [Eubacteriales bacterium]